MSIEIDRGTGTDAGAGLTLAAVGDLVLDDDILTPRLEATAPGLLALLRDAHVTIGNFETTAIDFDRFTGWPEAEPGGSWLVTSVRAGADVRAMGIDMVSRANNHATDWGVAGLRSTSAVLDEAGLVHAGAGESLTAARAPRYLTTRRGRVALVSAASRYQAMSLAADPFGIVPARPGINGLRTTRWFGVRPDELRSLAAIRDSLPPESLHHTARRADARDGSVTLGGTAFISAEATGGRVGPYWKVEDEDVAALRLSVRQARQNADVVAVALHTHEPGNHSAEPPPFLHDLAHAAVDEGADVVLGHGPHQLRGIEVYRNRPIFYSLGNFVFMQNRQFPLTREAWRRTGLDPARHTPGEMLEQKRTKGPFDDRIWYESVAVSVSFENQGEYAGQGAVGVTIHPVTLTFDARRDSDRGTPGPADVTAAHRILNRLRTLSEAYGTEILLDGDQGRIRIDR
ncbi:CapA family protein [Streptomyces geranii]|uniref:CapA family protein n=1 Tax=Streptomyces geranii TaxID=2058923 RepID=UPI000D035E2B|nr:CapA family protein [Streptomyces geranii]